MESSDSLDSLSPSHKRLRERSALPPAKRRRVRKLTPIETLPGEILEKILYYSANIYLTQASPTILNTLNGLHSKQSSRIYKNFSVAFLIIST
jgi:hypothetical protein